jgi:putative SOS response-associated peptidase YedK
MKRSAVCNLYGMRVTAKELMAHNLANEEWRRQVTVEKDYCAPGKPGYVIREEAGRRVLDTMIWGFPGPEGKPVTNVRNYASPFWRRSLADPARRCLVPVSSFNEYSNQRDVQGRKRKFAFSIPSRPIFSFAGIWRPADEPEGTPFYSFLTCGYDGEPAAHCVGRVHAKAIPVILHEEDHDRWLHAPIDEALTLACPFPSQLLKAEPA